MSGDSPHHHQDGKNDLPSGFSSFSQGGQSPHEHKSTELSGMPRISQRAPPRRIDHTYRDFSNYPIDALPKVLKSATNFPSKLHHILSDPEYHHVSQNCGHVLTDISVVVPLSLSCTFLIDMFWCSCSQIHANNRSSLGW